MTPEDKAPIHIPDPREPVEEVEAASFFRRHQKSIWISLLTIAVGVAALLGYILFFRQHNVEPEYAGEVRLRISAPRESVSGSELSYTITITNLSNTTLTRSSLEMFYPAGFSFVRAQLPGTDQDSDPSNSGEEGRKFDLPDLPADGEYTAVLVGRLEGNVREIKTVRAKLHYVPENFNSFFFADTSASVVILPPDVTIRVLGPSSVISGQLIEYEVEIRNISTEEFTNLSLELSYPEGFSFVEAVPASVQLGTGEPSQTEWRIERLVPGGTQRITVEGRMNDPAGEEVYLTAELFTTAEEGKLSAGRSYIFTKMLGSPLRLTQRLDGGEGTLFGGEELRYEINYENVGQIGLSNVTIALKFDTDVFDFSKSKSQEGQLRSGEYVWIPAAVPELRTVQIGQNGEFAVQVRIREESQLTQKNPVVQTRLSFSADELSEPIIGEPLTLKIGTNVNVESAVQLVSGPEDPQVGQTSVYLVTLTVTNSVSDVENAILTARVPGSTVTVDEESLEPEDEKSNVEYIPNPGLLRWNLGKIFAYTGNFHSPRRISFRLAITPEKPGSGRPTLLSDVEVSGLDSFTGEQIFSNNLDTVKSR